MLGRAPVRRVVLLLLLVFAAIVVIDALVGDGGLLAVMRAQKHYGSLATGLERLKAENEQLREANRRLRDDPAALEEAARRDLGLMKPGEKVFIIKDLPSPSEP
jgi:cell division protein FtsB